MKRINWMTALLLIIVAGTVLGQGGRILEIRAGYLNPKDAAAGMILGGSYGVTVDDRVDISLGLSYFHKKYVKDSEVADTNYVSGINERTVMRELEYSTTLLPITANVNVRFPLGNQGYNPKVYWFAGASLAYEFLFNTENNYVSKEKRNYRGWGWMARAGIEYALGSRSALLLEAFYNSSKVKRNQDEKLGFPVWDEVNVSGLGFRAGLRLEFY
jgi:hypothetical protein